MFEPIERRSVSGAVFDQIRELIVGGGVEPGAKLPAERELATKLGVNRNAVREALSRLAQLRLVAIQPGGSTRVLDFERHAGLDLFTSLLFGRGRTPRRDAVRSLFELRTALGPDIAARAAERRGDDVPARIHAIVDRMSAVPSDVRALEAPSMELWRELVHASGNVAYRLLFNTLEEAHRAIAEVVASALAPELTDRASYAALARAIEDGDAVRARRVAQKLLSRGEDGVAAILDVEAGR